MTFNPQIDRSTLNQAELSKLPAYESVSVFRNAYIERDSMGSGCYGDPPGYPTYFIQHVYIAGNNPPRGPQAVIRGVDGVARVIETDRSKFEDRDALMRKLYTPLPIDHPRVQAWISSKFTHLAHCYHDAAGEIEPYQYGKPVFFVYPLPSYKLRHFTDDPRFSEEWRAKEQASIKQANDDLEAKAVKLATFDNHNAVRYIREHYPDFNEKTEVRIVRHSTILATTVRNTHITTASELVHRPEKYNAGDWMEVHNEQPTPAECANKVTRHDAGYLKHREGWCQFCGTLSESDAELARYTTKDA